MKTIAVIGAGPAGRAFALRCAQAGYAVVLEDVMPANLRRAQDEYSELSVPIAYASTVEDAVRGADLAIDFVPDELESKLEIFSLLDRMAPPRTILCTPTEALSITDLASCTYRSERCVGLHGLAAGKPDVIRSRFVQEEVLRETVEWLSDIGFKPDVIEDQLEPMLMKNLPKAVNSE